VTMLLTFILCGFLITAFLMTMAKRVTALIGAFRMQAVFLFLYTLAMAVAQKHLELFLVAGLIFALKVAIIPYVLARIVRRIDVEENLGLIVNPTISLIIALCLSGLAYTFAHRIMPRALPTELDAFVVSIAVICIGFFIMVSRLKALSQVLGLLAMENGIFLAAAAITGGMPFFVEIALAFDLFLFVIIVEIFVYRVNRLFTHIDTSKMNSLKG
jgi:hydrogenase-4 component E